MRARIEVMRTCAVCGTDIGHRKANAVTCSPACRQAKRRRARGDVTLAALEKLCDITLRECRPEYSAQWHARAQELIARYGMTDQE